jgi:hypothetical protein
MDSLTKGQSPHDLRQLLRDAEPNWGLIEDNRRKFAEAERQKQEIWAEYERSMIPRRRSSRFRRFTKLLFG